MAWWMLPAAMAGLTALTNKDTAERKNRENSKERERQARMSKWAGFNNAFIPTGVEEDVNPWTAALQGGLVGGLTGAQLPEGLLSKFGGDGSSGNMPKSASNPLGADVPEEYLNKPNSSSLLGIGSLSQGFAKPQASQNDMGILQALLSMQNNGRNV